MASVQMSKEEMLKREVSSLRRANENVRRVYLRE